MDYFDWFANRLSALRLKKGVSAREMSLALGQSESYINKIENKRTLPSMAGFFYICEYLGIEPRDFFDTDSRSPITAAALAREFSHLSEEQSEHILAVIRDLNFLSSENRQ